MAMDALEAYERLLVKVEAFFQSAIEKYPQQIRCHPGCDDCCKRDLELLPFELERLIAGVKELDEAKKIRVLARAQRAQEDPQAPCPLLEDGQCQVYQHRPIICRTHGLPLLMNEGQAAPSLSVCPLNFIKIQEVEGACVLDLDPLNKILATVNHLVCSERGISPGRLPVSRVLQARLRVGENR